MSKIVYLLGAGASIDSLPVVEQFENEVAKILKYVLSCYTWIKNYKNNAEDLKCISFAINDLRVLEEGCRDHRSVDTFAKMLYLTSHIEHQSTKYKKTKDSITLFFELYRFINKKTDKRYDAFIATIMQKQQKFPKDINVLSWNYDYEFERAYTKYIPDKKDIHQVYEDLNIIHKNRKSNKLLDSDFRIIKINGTSGYYSQDGNIVLGLGCRNSQAIGELQYDSSEILNICRKFQDTVTSNEKESAISFSWEEDTGTHKMEEQIKSALDKCQVLIVIGYSFPYFNREWDKLIFDNIGYGNAQIIVQDPSADDIIENLKGIRKAGDLRFKAIRDCRQYYMV